MRTESKNAQKLHKGRAFSYKLIEAYHRRFLDKKTGKFLGRHTKHRPCPVCDANKPLKVFDKSGSTYVVCAKCSMVYVNPVLLPAPEYRPGADHRQRKRFLP
jgi:hypothetical protein